MNPGSFTFMAVDDIQAALKKIMETGAPLDDAPKQGADHNWQCWTHDPDGNKIELLKKYIRQPLVINQVQLSLEQSQLIDQALYMNNKSTEFSINRDGNALDYCRLKDITIQAWSPLQFGMFGGSFIDHPDFPKLNQALAEIADREKVSKAAVAIAWILRHPAKMQTIIGTMNPEHVKEACAATNVKLSHHDWYALYLAAGKYLP